MTVPTRVSEPAAATEPDAETSGPATATRAVPPGVGDSSLNWVCPPQRFATISVTGSRLKRADVFARQAAGDVLPRERPDAPVPEATSIRPAAISRAARCRQAARDGASPQASKCAGISRSLTPAASGASRSRGCDGRRGTSRVPCRAMIRRCSVILSPLSAQRASMSMTAWLMNRKVGASGGAVKRRGARSAPLAVQQAAPAK